MALWKTTLNSRVNDGFFSKNDSSHSTKQRVVFKKTTAHFPQNDVLFSKNDGSLYTNDVLFSKTHESRRKLSKKGKSTYPILRAERERFEIVKILKSILLARTRTCAVQRVLSFCCHKCHRPTHKTLIYKQPNKQPHKF